jgi:NAD(P)-dependent dehydrogenase (short-subunit alcohol dehydrogenase family)
MALAAAAKHNRRAVVVTGATTGIGYACAQLLASHFRNTSENEETKPLLLLGVRDPSTERAISAARSVERLGADAQLAQLDLSNASSVANFAREVNHSGLSVCALLHNAGVAPTMPSLSLDGLELAFHTHALGPHALTQLLKPSLHRAAAERNGSAGSVRVVLVGSRLEKQGSLLLELSKPLEQRFRLLPDADNQRKYSWMRAYSTSKQAATAAFYEHARRIAEDESDPMLRSAACVNVCSPGVVNTQLARNFPLWLRLLSGPLRASLLKSPKQGADTPVWLLTSEDQAALRTGKYFLNRNEIQSSSASCDEYTRLQVWDMLEALWARISSESDHTLRENGR